MCIRDRVTQRHSVYGIFSPQVAWGVVWAVSYTHLDRFMAVLKAAHEKTGLGAVVLIDEYDKPFFPWK